MGRAIKLTIEEVRSFVENNSDCELLSDEYVNARTKLKFKCKCGNIFEATFDKFKGRNKRQCDECGKIIKSEKRKFTIGDIRKFVEENSKCKLLSTKYIGINEKLKFKCKCGKEFETSFNKFKNRNKRQCNECGNNLQIKKQSLNINDIRKFVKENSDCELISTEYVNNHTDLKFRCKCGNIFTSTFSNFKNGTKQCNECIWKSISKKQSFSIKEVKRFVKENSKCKLLSKEYINYNTKLEFRCKCGNKFKTDFATFKLQNKRQCYECTLKKISGRNSVHYNSNKTDEEREKGRNILGKETYDNWRKEVYKKDNYTCQCCGEYGGKLNAHHLDGYNWCKEKRVDINNGITLCKKCHSEFHHIYGKGKNTKEQYEEFIQNKLNNNQNQAS